MGQNGINQSKQMKPIIQSYNYCSNATYCCVGQSYDLPASIDFDGSNIHWNALQAYKC